MSRPFQILLLAFAAALSAVAPALAGKGRGRVAAWVVRDQITSPEAVEKVVREARAAGVDTLVVQVRGRGDAYYRTSLAPRAEALADAPAGFDPLAEVLRRAKGLRVVAWLNVYYVWGGAKLPVDPTHVFWANGGWILEDRDGRDISTYTAQERALGWLEGVYVDPASVEYRAHFVQVAAEVAARYRVDGIHLDFVRYPGSGYGKGGPLGEEFRRAWGFDPRWIPRELESASPFALLAGAAAPSSRALATATFLWKDLRAEQVTQLVRDVRKRLRAGRRQVELSAAVFPRAGEAYLDKGQDWLTWASLGLVDALFPMVYFGGPERVEAQLREIAESLRVRAPKVRLYAGLGGYLKEPAQIAQEAGAAWELGCRGICLFDLGALRAKPGGAKAYVDAVRGARKRPAAKLARVPRPPAAGREAATLVKVLDRASGGRIAWTRSERRAAEVLWKEFQSARGGPIPEVVGDAEAATCREPEWAELTGIFRYVAPEDGEDRRLSQRQAAEDALVRLEAGEDAAAVAREVSQWGSRSLGGALERRYLDSAETTDGVLLSLAPGELSPVLEAGSGYWVYRLDARGGGETLPVADMPWPARRILYKRALSARMDADTRVSGAPAPEAPDALPR